MAIQSFVLFIRRFIVKLSLKLYNKVEGYATATVNETYKSK